jgi:hypothetical protein
MLLGRRPAFWARSIAISAWRIAIARSYDLPVLVRPSTSMVHFQPVGLAVWTTVYWMSLCSIGNSKMAANACQGLQSSTSVSCGQPAHCGPFKAPVRSSATSGDCNGSGTSQSMQRNLRPPVLTSMKRIFLAHFKQVGGGEFFGT